MSYQLLRYMTSTVGLITTNDGDTVDVMAAEWTSFVARDPLHIAVGIQKANLTHDLILAAREFSVTLCDAGQASIANFCGSFSGRDIDKTTSSLVEFKPAEVLNTPHVAGGVLNAECALRHVVDLPAYSLFIGEALWLRVDETAALTPLVKHGGMYTLGPNIVEDQVVAGGRVHAPGVITVAATSHGGDADSRQWTVRVSTASGQVLVQECLEADGDLLHDFPYDVLTEEHEVLCLQVERSGCTRGIAHVPAVVGAHSDAEKS